MISQRKKLTISGATLKMERENKKLLCLQNYLSRILILLKSQFRKLESSHILPRFYKTILGGRKHFRYIAQIHTQEGKNTYWQGGKHFKFLMIWMQTPMILNLWFISHLPFWWAPCIYCRVPSFISTETNLSETEFINITWTVFQPFYKLNFYFTSNIYYWHQSYNVG